MSQQLLREFFELCPSQDKIIQNNSFVGISKMYNMSWSAIDRVVKGKSWSKIDNVK